MTTKTTKTSKTTKKTNTRKKENNSGVNNNLNKFSQPNIDNLTNHFLIATPQMPDARFSQAVIYVCRHDSHGMLGLVINNPLKDTPVGRLLEDLDIECGNVSINKEFALAGGPVHPEVGFVLHTGQPCWASSFAIAENLAITTSRDVLEDIAMGGSVAHFQLCLGHVGWGRRQVKREIEQGDWLVCPADLSILFEVPYEERWHKAGKKLGVNMDYLSAYMGHA